MSKAPLYSRSRRRAEPAPPVVAAAAEAAATPQPVPAPPRSRARRWLDGLARHPTAVAAVAGALFATLAMLLVLGGRPGQRIITQDDIDKAVRASIEKEPLPSAAARAYEAIAPSVVRVVGLMDDSDSADDDAEQRAMERSLGTKKVKLRFWNGHESDAQVVGMQAENDLAVLKATSLPDDLQAATMRSTADLRPGDEVIAVGHPFGIGPSVSAGVVSGLKREFRSPEGETRLKNLIQFDAAANPGNSGGPLVTMDGHVVGIVTAILNPTEQRTFIGIGFAVPIENAAAAAGMPPF
jgi:hypothetical protein